MSDEESKKKNEDIPISDDTNTKAKIKKRPKALVLILFVCMLCGLSYAIFNIIDWRIDNKEVEKQMNNINGLVQITEVDSSGDDYYDDTLVATVSKTDPYWTYMQMNLMDVNFQELKNINSDVRGWLQVTGTNINYPFVQASDNSYYLNRSFNKSINNAGWVFLDYRNNIKTMDKNTIIYAHGRNDDIMFGTLKNIIGSSWYNNSNNYIVKMSTETHNTMWQVFSIYRIKTTSDYLQINFSSDTNYQVFLDRLKNRSSFDFKTSVTAQDKILTLSTCYNSTDKVVLHAKLIKSEAK